MPAIVEKLKSGSSMATLKFDDGCNAAVRGNNDKICQAAEESPEAGGNIEKMKEIQGEGTEITAHEYSVYKFEGVSPEEFVALLLYQDYDRNSCNTEAPKAEGEAEG